MSVLMHLPDRRFLRLRVFRIAGVFLCALVFLFDCVAPECPDFGDESASMCVRMVDRPDGGYHVGDSLGLVVELVHAGAVDSVVVAVGAWDTTFCLEGDEYGRIDLLLPLGEAGQLSGRVMAGVELDTAFIVAVKGYAPYVARLSDTNIVSVGMTCTLSVTIETGTGPFAYQWYRDTTQVAGSTDSSLVFTSVRVEEAGRYFCVIRSTDGWGIDTSTVVTIVVEDTPAPNQAPAWESDTLRFVVSENADIVVELADSCSDPDSDSLFFSLLESGIADDTLTTLGAYRCSPGYGDSGMHVSHVGVSDGAVTDTVVLLIHVLNVNRAPLFADSLPLKSYEIKEGGVLTIRMSASDPDGDRSWTLVASASLPHHTDALLTDTVFTWGSASNDRGLYVITVAATDGRDTTSLDVDIVVGDVNLPPVVSAAGVSSGDTLWVREQDTLSVTVTVTDPNSSDTPVLLDVVNAPYAVAANGVGGYDRISGRFRYSPSYGVSSRTTQRMFANVVFPARDNGTPSLSDTLAVHILVLDSNRAPVCSYGAASGGEDTPILLELVAHDPDGDDFAWEIVSGPSNGVLSGTAPNLTYTPAGEFSGRDTVRFRVSDGLTQSGVATYVITVGASNDAPTAADTSVTLTEDGIASFRLPVSDAENENLTLAITKAPTSSMGTLTVPSGAVKASAMVVAYTSKLNRNGSDFFRYQVSDGYATSREAYVGLQILPVNDAPSVSLVSPASGKVKVRTDTDYLVYSGSDVDGDVLTYAVYVGADSATLLASAKVASGVSGTQVALSSFSGFVPATEYYWRVVVVDNGVGTLGDSSEIRCFRTKNEAPVWALPETGDTSCYVVRWALDNFCHASSGGSLSFAVTGGEGDRFVGGDTLLFRADSQLITLTATDATVSGDVVQAEISFRSYRFVPAGMALIPAQGRSFQMGESELATPVHTVSFTYNYYVDTTEVTQGFYEHLTGVNPSWYDTYGDSDMRPVEYLTWYDAVLFCNARSRSVGLDTVYSYLSVSGTPGKGCSLGAVSIDYAANGFRLATEAEWEYACRAGTTTDFYWGSDTSRATIKQYAWYMCNANDASWTYPHADNPGPQVVAQKLPNAFGLYDIAGNVYEWCMDWHGEYAAAAQQDHVGPVVGTERCIRGGDWVYEDVYLRSGVRNKILPSGRFVNVGFRCVLSE